MRSLVTLTAELQRIIRAMEMSCYRKILRISYKDHVTSEEICAKIERAIGPHEDFLTIVMRRKLQWYDHVSRSSGLTKTILQGTVKGGRRQSRQMKRWEDNIGEQGSSLASPRGQSSLVSKWPSRLIIITCIYNALDDVLSTSRIHNKLKTILSK